MPFTYTASPSGIHYRIEPTRDAMAHGAAEIWVELAREDVEDRGMFSVALAGGSTPRTLYELMESEPFGRRVDWSCVEFFFGDERNVGPEHRDSNFRMARENLFERLPVDVSRIHRMRGEVAGPRSEGSDLRAEAARYAAEISSTLPANDAGIPVFDLVLLGMGEDGHTASLFPHTQALEETELFVAANEVPQLNTHRLTLTLPVLNAARFVMFLCAGKSKAWRAAEILGADSGDCDYPACLVRPDPGRLLWLLDDEAAVQLERRL